MNLSSKNRINLAGLLLFGDKPQLYKPEFIVKAVVFAGKNISDHYLDSEDFEGPLSAVFQGSLAFIMRNLHKIQKQRGINTVGEPEIPQIVFEELLVNALIHRDYFVSAPIRLFIFDDRIEIINPILASFAAKGLLPYRGLGTGVRRALQDWPQIQFTDNRDGCLFTSLVSRIKVQNAPINAPINASLSHLQQQILEFIRTDSKVSYEELMTKLNKDRTTIMRAIQKMKAAGILQRSGSKKTGHWEIL